MKLLTVAVPCYNSAAYMEYCIDTPIFSVEANGRALVKYRSMNTIHRMKHGKAISTSTLDILCDILDCKVEDVIVHEKDE